MQPLLDIRDLCITFPSGDGPQQVVHHISFTLNRGATLAIVGESGSGKSVTALSVLQLLPPKAQTSGSIMYHNDNAETDLLHLQAKQMNTIRGNRIAMIFQEPMTSLNPVFTCGQQVMESLRQHKKMSKAEARKKAVELFTQVQLPNPGNIIDRYPHQLSGGQKQRVMIAMAMSCDPDILIADEPTTALDVTVQKNILSLLRSLQQQNGMSIILITHDLGLVADTADKVAVMYKGTIVEQGPARELLFTPQHPYTKALLACRPALHGKGERLPVVSDFLSPSAKEAVIQKQDTAPAAQPNVLLDIKDLHVHFPERRNLFGQPVSFFKAVDGVSFTVNTGEIVGLVGESGCGKTTLGRALLRLVPVTSGQILLNGKDISGIKAATLRDMRKDLQIVFQDPYGSLNPRISIGEAILEPMKVHGLLANDKARREKVADLLEKVNLQADHYHRYPHQFSGGQRQRICIARALALHPSFLVFDESVSALDVSVQAQVLNLLNDLKAEFGFTAVFISHDLSVVHYLCNRIMVMHKGKIIEEGNAEQVYHHPVNAYTKTLIDAIPGRSLAS